MPSMHLKEIEAILNAAQTLTKTELALVRRGISETLQQKIDADKAAKAAKKSGK